MFRSIQEWLSGPWRRPAKDKWNKNFSDKLKEDIRKMQFKEDIKKVGILLCGPHQSGKSSFVNTVFSISKGRPAHFVLAIASKDTVTSKFRIFPDEYAFGNFEIKDTHGMAENEGLGFNVEDLAYALDGHIKENYEFKDTTIETTNTFYKVKPCAADKSYCLVFVVDAQLVAKFTDKHAIKFKQVVKKIEEKGIPMVLLLTKVDVIYPYLKKDMRYLFHSSVVENAVRRAEETYGVQMKNIHPIVNLVEETEVDPVRSIPILLALKQILEYASDNIETQSRKSVQSPEPAENKTENVSP